MAQACSFQNAQVTGVRNLATCSCFSPNLRVFPKVVELKIPILSSLASRVFPKLLNCWIVENWTKNFSN